MGPDCAGRLGTARQDPGKGLGMAGTHRGAAEIAIPATLCGQAPSNVGGEHERGLAMHATIVAEIVGPDLLIVLVLVALLFGGARLPSSRALWDRPTIAVSATRSSARYGCRGKRLGR